MQERTVELLESNKKLKKEISSHIDTMKTLRKSKAEAEASNIAKSTFLRNMSHELRTPLNHIYGYTDLFLEGILGELTEEQKENLDYIKDSSRYLLSLINDILDLAESEGGGSTFRILIPLSIIKL